MPRPQPAKCWVKNILRSPPPGHILVNGELNLSLFEHQVKHCEPVESYSSEDTHFHYGLEAEGLKPTNMTLESRSLSLENNPTEYYLFRVWNQHTNNMFRILVEFMKYIFKDSWRELWSNIHDESAKIKSGSSRDRKRQLQDHLTDGILTHAQSHRRERCRRIGAQTTGRDGDEAKTSVGAFQEFVPCVPRTLQGWAEVRVSTYGGC